MKTRPFRHCGVPRPLDTREHSDAMDYARERRRELRELRADSGCFHKRKLPGLDERERDE